MRRQQRSLAGWFGLALVALGVTGTAAWGTLALLHQAPGGAAGRVVLIGLWLALALVALVLAWRRPIAGALLQAVGFGALLWWWGTVPARLDRDWARDVAVQFTAVEDPADPGRFTLSGVRNFEWRSDTDFTDRWETRVYDADAIVSVDAILSHWSGPAIAHVMVSFGFADGRQLAFSVEIRKTVDEVYSEIGGFFKEFELALIAADERDVLRLRTNVRGEDVYLYRVAMPPEARRALFLSYLATANDLDQTAMWYNTVTANCTTLVFELVRRFVPNLPLDYRLVLSGYLPGYLYDLRALDMRYSLEQLTAFGRLAETAAAADAAPDFSAAIRAGIPPLPQ